MSTAWPTAILGEVCDFVRGPFGGALKKSTFKPSGFAVYEQQHAINNQFTDFRYFVDDEKFEEMKRFSVNTGDLIMSCSGTMGKVAQVPKGAPTGIINQALLKLSPHKELCPRFLSAWMTSPDFQQQLASTTVGVAIKNVASVKTLKAIGIPLPPLEEQKRIVAVLDQAFAALDRARANAEANLADAEELLNSAQFYASQHKTDWDEAELSDIIKVRSGDFLPKKAMNIDGGIPVFGGNGQTGSHDEANLNGKNILIGRVGAKCGNVHVVDQPIWLTDNAFHVCEVYQDFDLDFLALILDRANLRSVAKQAAQPVISGKTIGPVRVRFPKDKSEQREHILKLKQIEEQTVSLVIRYEQKFAEASDLRQSILQKAFAGELT